MMAEKKNTLSLAFNEEQPEKYETNSPLTYLFIKERILKPAGKARDSAEQERKQMQNYLIYYKLKEQGEFAWRLLTPEFRNYLPTDRPLSIQVIAYTASYQQENLELIDQLELLRDIKAQYQLEKQELRNQQELDDARQSLPRVTFLYGSPIYEDQPENIYSHPPKYLKILNALVGTLRGCNVKLKLEVEVLNENKLKNSLGSRILFCVAHGEEPHGRQNPPDYLFGENQYGGLERVRLISKTSQVRFKENDSFVSSANNHIKEEDMVDLLVLQTTCSRIAEPILSRYARSMIVINSNVLFEDEAAEGFITELFRLLLKNVPIRDAFNASVKAVQTNGKYLEKFLCCCFHPHDPEVCKYEKNRKKNQQAYTTSSPSYYTNFHYRYHRLLGCTCPKRYQLIHENACENFHDEPFRCCCAGSKLPELNNSDIHSFEPKFQLKSPDRLIQIRQEFKSGKMDPVNDDLLRAYSEANDKGYSRAGHHQKEILAKVMMFKKQFERQNRSRFAINIFGGKGSGKEHLKNMLINYLIIKRDLLRKENHYEITQALNPQQIEDLVKQRHQVIVLDLTWSELDYKKMMEPLLRGGAKLILISEKAVESNDVEKFECKPLTSDDAYHFIVRELKNTKLTEEEKKLLRSRLKKTTIPLYPSTLLRAVKELEATKDRNFKQFLDRKLEPLASKFDERVQRMQTERPNQFSALVVLSQWEKISPKGFLFLLGEMQLKVDIESLKRQHMLVQNNGNYSVPVLSRIKVDQLSKEELKLIKTLIRVLLKEAFLLVRQTGSCEDLQKLVDGTTNNPSSLLSVYLEICRQGVAELPLTEYLSKIEARAPKLTFEEMYDFLMTNLHKGTVEDMRDDILCRELVCLTSLLISHELNERQKLDRQHPNFASIIIRTANKRKDPNDLDLEQTVLAIVALELQIHDLMEILIAAHHRRNNLPQDRNQQAEDKKIEECMNELSKLKKGLEVKLENAGLTDRFGYLLSVTKFNMFLIEVERFTCLEPIFEQKEELTPLRLQGIQAKNSLPEDHEEEKHIRALMTLRKQYEESLGRLKSQPIRTNHAHLKEIVRLLVSENYNLRIHTITQLPQTKRYLRELHHYIEEKIRCQRLLRCISKQKTPTPNEYLEVLDSLTRAEVNLQNMTKREEVKHMYIYQSLFMMVNKYCRQLREKIQICLEDRPIFSLLTAYPSKCQCSEKRLGVSVELTLANNFRDKSISVVMEEKSLTVSNLKSVLERGSQYLCIWLQYMSTPHSLYIENEQAPADQDLSYKRRESYHGEEIEKFISLLPSQSKYVSQRQSTIFVCGSEQLAYRLSLTKIASNIVYFTSDAASTAYAFYEKKLFMSEAVVYFVKNMSLGRSTYQNNTQAVGSLLHALQRQKNIPSTFREYYIPKIKVLEVKEKEYMEIQSATESRRKDPEYTTQISAPLVLHIEPVSAEMKVSRTRVYLAEKEDTNIEKLRQCSRMSLLYEKKSKRERLNDFIDYLKGLCLKKHLFPGGVYIIDWKHDYKPHISSEGSSEDEPVHFLDKKLGRKLPLLARTKSLIIMKNCKKYLFGSDVVREKSTFAYLVRFFKDPENSKISLLFCHEKDTSIAEIKMEDSIEIKDDFKALTSPENELLDSSEFPNPRRN